MTPKQEAYCQAVAGGLEPIEAAKSAGYNPESITRQVHRMQNNQEVQNRIAELKAIKHIQARDETGESNAVVKHDSKSQSKVKALDFLFNTYNDPCEPMKIRVQAAIAALPYEEAKLAPKGKKEDAIDTAKQATSSGKFATFSNQQDFFETQTVS